MQSYEGNINKKSINNTVQRTVKELHSIAAAGSWACFASFTFKEKDERTQTAAFIRATKRIDEYFKAHASSSIFAYDYSEDLFHLHGLCNIPDELLIEDVDEDGVIIYLLKDAEKLGIGEHRIEQLFGDNQVRKKINYFANASKLAAVKTQFHKAGVFGKPVYLKNGIYERAESYRVEISSPLFCEKYIAYINDLKDNGARITLPACLAYIFRDIIENPLKCYNSENSQKQQVTIYAPLESIVTSLCYPIFGETVNVPIKVTSKWSGNKVDQWVPIQDSRSPLSKYAALTSCSVEEDERCTLINESYDGNKCFDSELQKTVLSDVVEKSAVLSSSEDCVKRELHRMLQDDKLNFDNIEQLKKEVERKKKEKEYIELNGHVIWQGKNGNWFTYLPDATKPKGRKLVNKTKKQAVINEIFNHYDNGLNKMTVRQVFDDWNDTRLNLKHESNATHTRYIQDANRYLADFGSRPIGSITEKEITTLLVKRQAELHLTSQAFTNLKTIVKGTIKHAKSLGLTNVSYTRAFEDVDIPKNAFAKNRKEPEEEVFSTEEYDKLMEYLVNHLDLRNLALLVIMLTGLRPGEVTTLKGENIVENIIRVRRTETRFCGKDKRFHIEVKEFPKTDAGWRDAIIPIQYAWVADRLRGTSKKDEYVFMENGERLTTQKIRRRLYSICEKLELVKKSPNKGRKTWFSIMLDNGIDENLVKTIGGHTDIRTTEGHYHRDRKTVEKKAEIISGIEEFSKDFRKTSD